LKGNNYLYILRNIEGNAEEELLNMTDIYRQMIKVFVKISRRQATTNPLPCVRMKYGYSQ